MNIIEIQTIYNSSGQPDQEQIQRWVDMALDGYGNCRDCCALIVDEQESAELNQQYRHKPGPTNILSFPVEVLDGIGLN